MKKNNPINFGFVVLVSDRNRTNLQLTSQAIRNNFPNAPHLGMVDDETPPEIFKELNKICPTFYGKKTITSLINKGVKSLDSEWAIIMMAGVYVTQKMTRKLFSPLQDEKDILFPIMPDFNRAGKPINLHATFPEGSLNGFMVHKKTFVEIGDLTDNPLEISKTMWAIDAIEKGCTFKGVLTKIL